MLKAMISIVAVAGLVLALAAGAAQAAPLAAGTEIGVDFGPTASLPASNFNEMATTFSPTTGPGWGTLADTTIAAGSVIETSAGNVVDGVSIVLTDMGSAWHTNNNHHDNGEPGYDGPTHLVDRLGGQGSQSIIVTFSGLNDSFTYDLNIGSYRNTEHATAWDTIWTVDGNSLSTVHDSIDDSYVDFTGLTTATDGGTGTLVIAGTLAPSRIATTLSALRLTAVPEPASAVLLVLGLPLVIRRRRRR